MAPCLPWQCPLLSRFSDAGMTMLSRLLQSHREIPLFRGLADRSDPRSDQSAGVRSQQPTARGWDSFSARRALLTGSGPPDEDGAAAHH
jgi:hypothetical protein